MIAESHTAAALKALHWLFVHQRSLALDRGDRQAASYFDQAEYLPALMQEAEDRTDFFEQCLRSFAGQDIGACAAFNMYLRELGREQIPFERLKDEHEEERAETLRHVDPAELAAFEAWKSHQIEHKDAA